MDILSKNQKDVDDVNKKIIEVTTKNTQLDEEVIQIKNILVNYKESLLNSINEVQKVNINSFSDLRIEIRSVNTIASDSVKKVDHLSLRANEIDVQIEDLLQKSYDS